MTIFNAAASFYLDPSVVEGSQTVDVSSIGMFFMYRPAALNNKSGVQYPGITMFLTDVVNGLPNMANVSIFQNFARCEWNQILTSSDASAETVFTFNNPITVHTGRAYAFCWAYDAGEDFLPWTNIKGNDLVGTTRVSTGPSSTYGGGYFQFSSIIGNGATPTNIQNYQTAWTALSSTDLKFEVYAARYATNGVPFAANLSAIPLNTPVFTSNTFYQYSSGNNTLNIIMPCPRTENILFDLSTSVKQSYVGSQRVYQNTVNYPGGGVYAAIVTNGSNTVTANATMSNGAAFSWNTIYGAYTGEKYVVINYGTSVDVRKIITIASNTVIIVDEATTAANSSARFMVSPVANTDSFNTTLIGGKNAALMFLRDSNANSTVRFVGHSVDFSNVTFSNTGTGYSNSDVFYVTGQLNVPGAIVANYVAVANLSTNSTGGVLSLNFSNTGAGFVNSAQVHFVVLTSANALANSVTANTSAGANLVPILNYNGTTLLTEQSSNIFRNARPINLDVHSMTAITTIGVTANTSQNTSLTTIYYMANNALTPNGFITYVGAPQTFQLSPGSMTMLNQLTNIPVVASRSLEFETLYANGAPNDKVTAINAYSNNYLMTMSVWANNDFVSPGPFSSPLLEFGRYIFNNDYTNENTDYGNAYSKHITTVFNVSGPANTNLMAEDLRFYLSAWRPPGTDIQAFARIQNSTDVEPFVQEDWTRMTLVTGSNNYSTTGYVDLTYGFQGQPNTTLTLAGTASIANGSANLIGSNTAWSSIANNTLLKVYDPLFPNSNFAVVLATGVVNSSLITVDQVFSTNTVIGIGGTELTGRGGLMVDTLAFSHQGFNNIQNDNVVRYYNTLSHTYDGFNIVEMKCVFLSTDPHFIPRIHNLRGVAVSAVWLFGVMPAINIAWHLVNMLPSLVSSISGWIA